VCFSEVGWCFCSQAVACVNPCSLSLSNSLAYSIDDCCNSLASSLNPALGDKFTLRFASDRSRPDPQDAFDALLDHPAITRRCYPRVAGALPGVANLLSLYSTGVHAQVGRSTLTPFLPKESYRPKRQIQRYLSVTSFKPSFDFVQTRMMTCSMELNVNKKLNGCGGGRPECRVHRSRRAPHERHLRRRRDGPRARAPRDRTPAPRAGTGRAEAVG
jgi:hypothetical protein